MADFKGFSTATVKFIAGLSANNSRNWFEAHRDDYDAHYIGAAKDFITAMAGPLQKLIPGIQAEPRVNGSIFRINRDIRFSKDKTPYKDHLDLWFWTGERKAPDSGLFFRLTKDKLILGAGVHMFDPARLAKYRAAVAGKAGGELVRIGEELGKAGLELQGEHYKKLPRGFEAANAQIERLLRFNALFAMHDIPHPAELGDANFCDYCVEKWQPMAPLHNWLASIRHQT